MTNLSKFRQGIIVSWLIALFATSLIIFIRELTGKYDEGIIWVWGWLIAATFPIIGLVGYSYIRDTPSDYYEVGSYIGPKVGVYAYFGLVFCIVLFLQPVIWEIYGVGYLRFFGGSLWLLLPAELILVGFLNYHFFRTAKSSTPNELISIMGKENGDRNKIETHTIRDDFSTKDNDVLVSDTVVISQINQATKEGLIELISSDQISIVLKRLSEYSQEVDPVIYKDIIQLKQQWVSVKTRKNMSLISESDASLQSAKIIRALIGIVEDLEEG